MAIYDLSKVGKRGSYGNATAARVLDESFEGSHAHSEPQEAPVRGRVFSALAARLFFLLLLVADLVWMGCTCVLLLIHSIAVLCTGGRVGSVREKQLKKWIALRRSLVCAVALCLALFSPSFGIMVACTYFLMYDKSGIQEVVPTSLQSQFKDLLPE